MLVQAYKASNFALCRIWISTIRASAIKPRSSASSQNFKIPTRQLFGRRAYVPARVRKKRNDAHRLGIFAECMAAMYVMLKGYTLLNWRYAIKGGELDLIVRRGNTIAFVEIKARSTHQSALDAITGQKIRRLRRAMRTWLCHNSWAACYSLRADVITIAPFSIPRHIIDAFTLSGHEAGSV